MHLILTYGRFFLFLFFCFENSHLLAAYIILHKGEKEILAYNPSMIYDLMLFTVVARDDPRAI